MLKNNSPVFWIRSSAYSAYIAFGATLLLLGSLGATMPANAADDSFNNGNVIALQGDTGNYFTRCAGCQRTSNNLRDTVTMHVQDSSGPWAKFEVVAIGTTGRIALRADTGNFVARCNGCIPGAAYPDSATIHVSDSNARYAQFTPRRLANGKYTLQSDTGGYLTRCNGCSPGSSSPDTVTMHVTDPNSPFAQWDVKVLKRAATASSGGCPGNGWKPGSGYTIPGTNGRNLHYVQFTAVGGGEKIGEFKQTGCTTWVENGVPVMRNGRWDYQLNLFNFTETGRDEWSVYLVDRSRNVNIQIDYYRKRVIYSQGGGPKSDLYQISSGSHVAH